MEIDKESLEEFKAAWRKDFGEDLTDAEARELATRLLTLYEIIYRPLPPTNNSESKQRR